MFLSAIYSTTSYCTSALSSRIPHPSSEKIQKVAIEALKYSALAYLSITFPLTSFFTSFVGVLTLSIMSNMALRVLNEVCASPGTTVDQLLKSLARLRLTNSLGHYFKVFMLMYAVSDLALNVLIKGNSFVGNLADSVAFSIGSLIAVGFSFSNQMQVNSVINTVEGVIEERRLKAFIGQDFAAQNPFEKTVLLETEKSKLGLRLKYEAKQLEWLTRGAVACLNAQVDLDDAASYLKIASLAVIEELQAEDSFAGVEAPPTIQKHHGLINAAKELSRTFSPDQMNKIKHYFLTDDSTGISATEQNLISQIQAIAYPLQVRCAPFFQEAIVRAADRHAFAHMNVANLLTLQWEKAKRYKAAFFYNGE